MKIQDKDLETLLNRIENWEESEQQHFNSAEQFIKDFPVEPSEDRSRVITEVIYYFYLNYCFDNNLVPMEIRKFFSHFTGKFKKGQNEYDKFYFIKPEKFFLTDEEKLNLQRQRRYYKHVWLPRSKRASAIIKKTKQKRKLKAKQEKLKEKLKRKHLSLETKSETSDSTGENSPK